MVIRRGSMNWVALTIVAAVLAGCDTRAPAVRRVLLDRQVPVPELAAAKFGVSTAERGYLLVEVSQEGADVQIELRGGGQRLLFDAPGRRAGPERGCMFAPAGAFDVRVTPLDGPGPPGNHARVVISSESADEAAAPDSALAAECREAHGGADHEQWKSADLAAQLADYVSAAETWERHGQRARAAMARLQAAWLVSRHMPRSDANVSRSAGLGAQARDGFRALDDCVGASHAAVQLAVPGALRASDLAKRGATAEAAAAFAAVKRDLLAAIACYEKAGRGYFVAEAYNSLGSVSHYSGDDVSALSQLAESAARFRSLAELGGARLALSNASIVLSASGQYREAARGFDELLASGGSAAADDALADILDSSATTHVAVGNYDKALGELLQSSAIHENSQDLGGLARSLNGFAFAYLSIGDAGAARDYAQRAVSVRERLAPEDRGSTESEQIMSLLIEGNAQRQLGDLPAAIVAHQRALRLSRADSLGVQARLELARDRLRQHAPSEALRLLVEAAAKVRTTWGTLAAQIELERARAHAMSGSPQLARKVLQQLKGRFGAAGQPTLEIEVLQQLAAAQLALGSRAAARRTSAECIARLEELRLATVNPLFRARLVATHRAAYELEVEMLLADHASATEPAARTRILTEIFAASDAARAGLVRELATAAPSEEASGADAEVRELAAEIALQEYLLQQEEYGITLADGGAPLRERLADLRARFDSITARLAPAGAGYTAAQYSWRDIAPDTAVLSFVHSSAGLRRFLFTNDGALELPVVATQPVTAALGALLADVTGTRDRETPALEVISRLLLPSGPALGGKRRWIIVADSITSAVPFAGLSLAEDYRPVILEHELSMALTTRDALRLARQGEKPRGADLGRIAIFADPVFSPLDARVKRAATSNARPFAPTPRLAATAKEAAAIVAQLPGADLKVFEGFDASRAAVLSPYVNSASVLHFATHATSSDEWPHGSGLMLSGVSREGEIINGYLSSLDLLVSRRSTDLVVLSACDTARGESTQTENVAGLARAFLGSGARRVIGTLWAVEDSATASLMREFYQRLAHGRGASAALREAQAAMASSDRFHRPAAWSAFVIYEGAPAG
jgi:tetratricopeptide (TPR) repeat protein